MKPGRKSESWKGRTRASPPIISPQTAYTGGDRPTLMNKVTNLSLIKQREASEKVNHREEGDNWQETALA